MVKLPPLNIAAAIDRISATVSKYVVQYTYELRLFSYMLYCFYPNYMHLKKETISCV